MFTTISSKASSNYFCYSHILDFHDGKCKNLHGHNGMITIEVIKTFEQFSDLENPDFVVDFKILKDFLNEIEQEWDHKFIVSKENASVVSDCVKINMNRSDNKSIYIELPISSVSIVSIPRITSELLLVELANTDGFRSLIEKIGNFESIKLSFEETNRNIATIVIQGGKEIYV